MNGQSMYNIRQVNLIQLCIKAYQLQQQNLEGLVNTIISALGVIETTNNDWKEDVRAEVNTLLLIHESTLDGSIDRWRGDPIADIEKTLQNLMELIKSFFSHQTIGKTEVVHLGENWLMCPKCGNSWEEKDSLPVVVCQSCNAVLSTQNGKRVNN